jgi:hypothetical protein
VHLRDMTKLWLLVVERTQVTGAGMKRLKQALPSLVVHL